MMNRKTILTNIVIAEVKLLNHEERGITKIPVELYIVMDDEYNCTLIIFVYVLFTCK